MNVAKIVICKIIILILLPMSLFSNDSTKIRKVIEYHFRYDQFNEGFEKIPNEIIVKLYNNDYNEVSLTYEFYNNFSNVYYNKYYFDTTKKISKIIENGDIELSNFEITKKIYKKMDDTIYIHRESTNLNIQELKSDIHGNCIEKDILCPRYDPIKKIVYDAPCAKIILIYDYW